jgi:hypothetical protein
MSEERVTLPHPSQVSSFGLANTTDLRNFKVVLQRPPSLTTRYLDHCSRQYHENILLLPVYSSISLYLNLL